MVAVEIRITERTFISAEESEVFSVTVRTQHCSVTGNSLCSACRPTVVSGLRALKADKIADLDLYQRQRKTAAAVN